ncbi:MAG: branched-chain amino acid ABC transporter ATP-binding protein, partial [Thaumarchaeota archaeon]
MLVLENVHSGYGQVEVLKGVSLEIKKGEYAAIIGA